MGNVAKIVKKLLVLFLFVSISIDTFAAVVGDNDGSAFVTKAEFDALKENFNDQIENYNKSIDNKIDGAIAAYLAGISLSTKEYKRSSLEVAGQTYQGVNRKSYVFCGNDSVYFIRRYNSEGNKFAKNYNPSFDAAPWLEYEFNNELWFGNNNANAISSGGAELWGPDQTRINMRIRYQLKDDAGNTYPAQNATIFVVDNDNYVTTFKVDAALQGLSYRFSQDYWNTADIMARGFVADASHMWKITFKDVVNANGTNGMGYSTRQLGDPDAAQMTIYAQRLYANNTNSKSGWTYSGKTLVSRGGTTYYIMEQTPYTLNNYDIGNNAVLGAWIDNHLHFEESTYGENYAWCMPFGHLLPNRKVACFGQWPAWNNVVWKTFDTQNLGNIMSSSTREWSDTTGNYTWLLRSGEKYINRASGLTRAYFNEYDRDIADFIEFDGMLPVWKENPMKDWRLLKNKNINNALSIDAYYAAAPPLTDEFSTAGTFTWVAKVNIDDVERIPGRNWSNWGNNRIYFTSKPMDDIEYDGTDVKVSNTKKFQYKKHDTTDDYADCQSQVINGKTYYYLTMDHNTYYDFKMDVEAKETVYYMVFDESRPNDYFIEVMEHPDYQIEFVSES